MILIVYGHEVCGTQITMHPRHHHYPFSISLVARFGLGVEPNNSVSQG